MVHINLAVLKLDVELPPRRTVTRNEQSHSWGENAGKANRYLEHGERSVALLGMLELLRLRLLPLFEIPATRRVKTRFERCPRDGQPKNVKPVFKAPSTHNRANTGGGCGSTPTLGTDVFQLVYKRSRHRARASWPRAA